MFELSAQLVGHTQDVKNVVAMNEGQLASVSRDGSVRIWEKDVNGLWNGRILYISEKFVNSLTWDAQNEVLFFGGQDMIIYGMSDMHSMDQEPVYAFVGHESNVCSLSGGFDMLVSCSWDKTARIWREGEEDKVLRGHLAAVWDAKVLKDGRVLTASADKSIKLWSSDGHMLKSFDKVHSDVVRCLCVLEDGNHFVSGSNDGTLKLSNLDGTVLHEFVGHESFVYGVKQLPSGEIVSCGEDRTVRIWNLDGTPKQVITLPAVSIWTVDVFSNGDIAVGSSDKVIRVFTKSEERRASEQDIQELRKQVEHSSVNSQTMGFDESKLKPYSDLKNAGQKEGQIIVVKNPSGVVEAHQWSNGKWAKVGDVVSAAGNDNKVEYEGATYDYVFDVDIEEGKPPLKLPVNANDNPYDVAEKFILRYELPQSYRDQIVQFIVTNTNSTSFDQSEAAPAGLQDSTGGSGSGAVVGAGPRQDIKYRILPVKQYLKLTSFDPDALFNGIVKLNEKENTFDDDALGAIGTALHDIDNNVELLYAHASIIKNQWNTSHKTPAFDIVRILAPKLPSSEDLSEFIEEGLSEENPISTMLTTRMLANSFSNEIWGKELMGKPAVYDSIFQLLGSDYQNCKPQHRNNLAVAIATLVFNYSVYITETNNVNVLPVVADALNTKYGTSSMFLNSEEATYRLLVAYGNLSTVEPTLHQYAKSIAWIKRAKDKYGYIQRFEDILEDLYR